MCTDCLAAEHLGHDVTRELPAFKKVVIERMLKEAESNQVKIVIGYHNLHETLNDEWKKSSQQESPWASGLKKELSLIQSRTLEQWVNLTDLRQRISQLCAQIPEEPDFVKLQAQELLTKSSSEYDDYL